MFEIDMKSRRSIYEQVVDNMKERILVGVIAPDEKLPSVRDLSKALTVNPNTVQKAFRELEQQGYIYTVTGVGSFASPPESIRADAKLIAESRAALADRLRELYFLTRDAAEVRRIVDDEMDRLPGQAKDGDGNIADSPDAEALPSHGRAPDGQHSYYQKTKTKGGASE
jgi:GntR family transcriptional regulator